MQFYSTAAYIAFLSSSIVSAFPAELELRAAVVPTCAGDNCWRFVKQATPAVGSSFCQSFLSSTPGTVTITASETSFTTPAQPTITTTIGTTTATVGIDCTTTTTGAPQYVKRAVSTPYSQQVSSACSSANNVAQTVRISSACSCFLTSATTTVTSTTTIVQPTPDAATATTSFAITETVSTCSSLTTQTIHPQIPGTCANIASPYTASNGKQYSTACDTLWSTYRAGPNGISFGIPSFAACVEICSQTSYCVGVAYNTQNGQGRCDCMDFVGGADRTVVGISIANPI